MREAVFIKQNQAKWYSYEVNLFADNNVSADELSEAYMELTSDLAFAQTHYPDSEVASYLNTITVRLHNLIYGVKRERWRRVPRFWLREVPLVVWQERRCFYASLLFFLLAVAIGVVSTFGDGTFARLILGDGYVDMTLENIRNGTPMGVYDSDDEVHMFLDIFFNNQRVGFMSFATGVLTSLFPIWIIVSNGVMIGAFEGFLWQFGVFNVSTPTVMLHGTIELTTLVVEGAAGIIMGNGWLFPDTYSRRVSFVRSAKRGVKVVVGTMPFVFVAAVIESFFTRHVEWPLWVKMTVIFVSLAVVLAYFVVLPIVVGRKEGSK